MGQKNSPSNTLSEFSFKKTQHEMKFLRKSEIKHGALA